MFNFCCLGGGRVLFCCVGGGRDLFLVFGRGRVNFLRFGRGACFCFCCLGGGRVFLLFGRRTGVHSLTGLPGSSLSDPTTKKDQTSGLARLLPPRLLPLNFQGEVLC